MFGWIKRTVSGFFNSTLKNPSRWLVESLSAGKSDSGVSVTAATAVGYAPVWYAVNKIAGHVGQLPITVHRRLDRGAEPATGHPGYSLLKTRPNKYQTAIQFKECLMSHALLWGDGRAAIIRDGNRIVELLPLPPDKTVTTLVDGEKWHVVTLDGDDRLTKVGGTRAGELRGSQYKIPDVDVLHIPGLGFDGVSGLSLIQCAKNVFGLGLGQELAANVDFANGSKPSVVLEAPEGTLRDPKDAQEMLDNFNTIHQGLSNRGRTALLREGVKANVMQMSNSDAEWIDQRRFQRQETALLFLLESILGDDSSVSYNSLEQKNLAYLSNCLMRWLVKWEQECDHKLRSQRERAQDSHFFKFNVGALLRADSKTQMETITGYIAARVYNPNFGRELLDLNPYEGGDEYENPAITPGSPGSGDSNSPEDANRAAIVAHLRHIIGVEAKQVLAAAGNKRDYIGWLDAFYTDEKWIKTIHRAITDMGGSDDQAINHCNKSKHELLEISGTVTPEGLADAVAELVEKWPDRAERLAENILNGELACV